MLNDRNSIMRCWRDHLMKLLDSRNTFRGRPNDEGRSRVWGNIRDKDNKSFTVLKKDITIQN